MGNVLSTHKQEEVRALGRLGWSVRAIGRATGTRRETVSKYLQAAGIAVRRPGWPSKSGHEVITDPMAVEAKPAMETITDSGGRSACIAHDTFIRDALSSGRTITSIFQELVDEHGFEARYASVQRYIRRLKANDHERRFSVIETDPGEEFQVDYGTGPMVRDASGKYRRTRLFVLTLCHSRKTIRLLTFKSSTQQWCRLHIEAFNRLGGTAQTAVLDNLREGVLKPDIYDPALNPVYRDMLSHYGVVALPCRVRDPNRKGKVESAVAHTQNAYRGKKFESLDEAQAWLDAWDHRWADTRIHGTTKKQVRAMFEAEKDHLQALPVEPFRMYEHGKRKVHLDGCVEVRSGYYSTPHGWVGREVLVQWDDLQVRILDPKTHELLREHLRTRPGSYRIQREDRAKHSHPGTDALVARAKQAGASIGEVASAMQRKTPQTCARRVQGLLSLVKRYGRSSVEQAAEAALECGAPDYRFVKRFLENTPQTHDLLRHVDPIIRELQSYRDLIERRATDGGDTDNNTKTERTTT